MAPVAIVCGVLFAIGFVEALSAERGGDVAFPEPLLVLYAVALYAAYAGFRRRAESHLVAPLPLYAAHAALLTVSVRVLDGALAVSVAWALGAIALLVYAVQRRDRMVGQSSLVVFSASSLKVLLHDLDGSTPIVRVGTLVVLAASLYAGGWLYQRMGGAPERLHPDPAVNEQLNVIRDLVATGLDDAGVVRALEERGLRRIRSEAGWTTALIAQIRADYGFR
jgi:hypothetical protein